RSNGQFLPERVNGRAVALKAVTPVRDPRFHQQSASARSKARKEKIFDQRQVRVRRRHAVAALHPLFRAQVLEIDPYGRRCVFSHGSDITLRKLGAETFDYDLSGLD